MSAYKVIKTEYRTLSSLIKAIGDLGYDPEVSPTVPENTLPMYGYLGDLRPETVAVKIDRKQISTVSNDVGFVWDGHCFNAVISEYDQTYRITPTVQNRLKQRYSVHEVTRLAALQGYSVTEEILPDGTINLVCTGYSY